MTYRELLDLYKKGKLAEEEAARVKKDIERQEAISEYLCAAEEALDIPLPDGLAAIAGAGSDTAWGIDRADGVGSAGSNGDADGGADPAEDFARTVNRSIRRAFRKLGVTVLVICLILILFVQFALPGIVSSFYYDPGEIVGKIPNEGELNQMSRDIAVYTELMLPGYGRDAVEVTDRGYGNYDINIRQTSTFTNLFSDVSGKIERGKLTLYNNSLLRPPVLNIFNWYDAVSETSYTIDTDKALSSLVAKEDAKMHRRISADDIAAMNNGEQYLAFVTLDRQMAYEDFIAWTEKNAESTAIWCAVRTDSSGYPNNLGFCFDPYSSTSMDWDREKYPNLFTWETDMTHAEVKQLYSKMKTEDFMKSHFTSLLRYMDNNEDFRSLIESCHSLEGVTAGYGKMADYVEKNGLHIYGFALVVQKDDAEKLLQADNVYSLSVSKLI